jgi:hypothetical protein
MVVEIIADNKRLIKLIIVLHRLLAGRQPLTKRGGRVFYDRFFPKLMD